MRLGLFGGGFKPFTSGHFSKLALASQENDVVVLFYGLAERKKGSDYFYTKDMAKEIMGITKTAIEREMRNVKVVEARPTPLVMIYESIGEVAGVLEQGKWFQLQSVGIDPDSITQVSVYGDEEFQQHFKKHIGTEKEKKYFGTMVDDGTLHFDTGLGTDNEMTRILDAMEANYPGISRNELLAKSTVRGSEVRATIASKSTDKIKRFLPPILSDEEKTKIISILYKGLDEFIVRSMIRQTIMLG